MHLASFLHCIIYIYTQGVILCDSEGCESRVRWDFARPSVHMWAQDDGPNRDDTAEFPVGGKGAVCESDHFVSVVIGGQRGHCGSSSNMLLHLPHIW